MITFALSVGHGNSDERSVNGNKGDNEWRGRANQRAGCKGKHTESITVQVAVRAPLLSSSMLIWSGLTGIL